MVSTLFNIKFEGSSANGFASELNIDFMGSVFGWVVDDIIGAISVVFDVNGDWTVGTNDFDFKGITTMVHVVAISVLGLDLEFSWQGVKGLMETRAIALGLVGIGSVNNVNSERTVSDVIIIHGNFGLQDHIHSVVTRVDGLVRNSIGSVVVVSHSDSTLSSIGSKNFNFDGVSTSVDLLTLGIASLDSKEAWLDI